MSAADPPAGASALVLDLDGLLIDTEEACFATAGAVLERYGVPRGRLTREEYTSYVGRPVPESYGRLRDRYGLSASIEELVAERTAHILRWYREPVLLPGAAELIYGAHAVGLPLAIASGAPAVLVDAAVAALPMGRLFAAAVSADHPGVRAAKPAPDAYLVACRLLGVDPAYATAIEDSPSGATAALAAGMATIVVPNDWTRAASFPRGVVVRDSLAAVLRDLRRDHRAA
ncbi:MAG: hypothetical protein QOE60_1084 [Thermoleophilaceae bacterium]|nr:hypothetical protein [Thermoleophilaceae bacterium]